MDNINYLGSKNIRLGLLIQEIIEQKERKIIWRKKLPNQS